MLYVVYYRHLRESQHSCALYPVPKGTGFTALFDNSRYYRELLECDKIKKEDGYDQFLHLFYVLENKLDSEFWHMEALGLLEAVQPYFLKD